MSHVGHAPFDDVSRATVCPTCVRQMIDPRLLPLVGGRGGGLFQLVEPRFRKTGIDDLENGGTDVNVTHGVIFAQPLRQTATRSPKATGVSDVSASYTTMPRMDSEPW